MEDVKVERDCFGKTADGEDVQRYTFRNGKGVSVQVIRYGGIVTTLSVPDRDGNIADICLGFDSLKEYETKSPYFGAIIGRVANRILDGKFTLDGKTYDLPLNDGASCLHGGLRGFDKKLWDASLDGSRLILKYTSEDGEEGFPGKVTAQVTYELTNDNEFCIDYTATTDKATPIMLTNHACFNLEGQGSEDIYNHSVQIAAEQYTPVQGIRVTGEIVPVEGTPFDLRNPARLGDRIKLVNSGRGFDENFCFRSQGCKKFIARVECPVNGRYVEIYSTEPGVQFYTGDFLNGVVGKGGAIYARHSGLSLYTQHFPDSVNQVSFPSIILRPGDTYHHHTVYKFGAMQ